MSEHKNDLGSLLAALFSPDEGEAFERLARLLTTTTDEHTRSILRFWGAMIAAERGWHAKASVLLEYLEQSDGFRSHASCGKAFLALCHRDVSRGWKEINRAMDAEPAPSSELLGAITFCRGLALYYENKDESAKQCLIDALQHVGPQHFLTGRIFEVLGLLSTIHDDFYAACAFYDRALDCKRTFGDSAGTAITHGHLGRLYLDWGYLAKAEEHFKEDLQLCRQIGDTRGEAQMCNHLGQVHIAQSDWERAASWMEESLHHSLGKGWPLVTAYAQKDLAITLIEQGKYAEANRHLARASECFTERGFSEGIAHSRRVKGMLLRAQGQYPESERELQAALGWFIHDNEAAEAARTELEIARTFRAKSLPAALVSESLQSAIKRAEESRRDNLVQEIESELERTDPTTLARHLYWRSRGKGVRVSTTSLIKGEYGTASVLFADIQGSTEYAHRVMDPALVMITLNQIMAVADRVLDRYGALVTAHLGDGFMALFLEGNHALRAASCSLDLTTALDAFNEPRRVLGVPPLSIRLGISTGEVYLGNVGTYRRMDYTAIGTTVNLAARLQAQGEPGFPCVSEETFQRVRDHVAIRAGCPRKVCLKGLGEVPVWDIEKRSATAV